MDRREYYKENSGHIHLDFETISAMEVTLRLVEVDPEPLNDFDRGNCIRIPDNDNYYKLEIIAGDEVIATNKNTSHNIWSALYNGALKDGDKVAVEMEIECETSPDKPEGDGWEPIFSEAIMVMYTRVKKGKKGHVMIHKSESLVRVGDEDRDYHRKFGDAPRKPSFKDWLESRKK